MAGTAELIELTDEYPEPTPRFDETFDHEVAGLDAAVTSTEDDFRSDFESDFGASFSTPQAADDADADENFDPFAPTRYTGSTLAGLEEANERDIAPTFDETEGALIGPAYVGGDVTISGVESAPLMGGFWIWFRDAIVLDKGEIDPNAELADVNDDGDEN